MKIPPYVKRSFVAWDEKRERRYLLVREWDSKLSKMVFIGLNSSAADEEYDDRTVRRCMGFAEREGCGSLTMLNAFSYRTTDPRGIILDDENCNDGYILFACHNAGKIIVAWGIHGKMWGRHERLLKLLQGRTLLCFGKNKDGTPKHPLYMRNDAKLEVF